MLKKILKMFSSQNVTLVRQLVITDFKLRYQGSVLGYLWSLGRPLMLFGILYIVFAHFFKFGDGIPNYPTYLLLGLVLWTYFVEATSLGLGAIVGRGDLIRKVSIPKYTIVLGSSISALVNLTLNLVVVFIFVIATGVDIRFDILMLPVWLLLLFIFATSISYILGALYVKFRDLSHIWEVVLQVMFYATPIIYPLVMVPEQFRNWLMINPLAYIIQEARYSVISDQTVRTGDVVTSWVALVPLVIIAAVAVFAVWFFHKKAPYFAEDL